jgi:WD40 repeat protein
MKSLRLCLAIVSCICCVRVPLYGAADDRDGVAFGRAVQLRGHEHAISAISFSADGNRFLSMDRVGMLLVWDAPTWERSGQIAEAGNGSSATFVGSDAIAATWGGFYTGKRPSVVVWDARTLKTLAKLPVAIIGESQSLFASRGFLASGLRRPAGGWFIEEDEVLRQSGSVEAWVRDDFLRFAAPDPAARVRPEKERFHHRAALSEFDDSVLCIHVAADDSKVVVAGFAGRADGVVAVFSLPAGELLWRNVLPACPVAAVRFCSGDTEIVTAAPAVVPRAPAVADPGLSVWDSATGGHKASWTAHAPKISCLSSNNRWGLVASGGADGRLKLWRVPNTLPVRELDPGWADVTCISFSPDGSLVVLGGPNGQLAAVPLLSEAKSEE